MWGHMEGNIWSRMAVFFQSGYYLGMCACWSNRDRGKGEAGQEGACRSSDVFEKAPGDGMHYTYGRCARHMEFM